MKERAIQFGHTASLIGVLSEPAGSTSDEGLPAVVILNAGITHRVGPNRLYVKIARDLAAVGFTVLRFDFSGIGDSEIQWESVPFDSRAVEETRIAMDYLATTRQAGRFVLGGLCSGANIAFRTACGDSRVVGIVGINGTYLGDAESQQVRDHVQNRVHGRYYRQHVREAGKWWRLITGKSDLRSIVRLVGSKVKSLCGISPQLPHTTHTIAEWNMLIRRGVDSLLVYSEGSVALDVFSLVIRPGIDANGSERLTTHVVPHADHIFTPLWTQRVLMEAIRTWMQNEKRIWRLCNPCAQAIEPARDASQGE
jgi:dienelactone hydrolase